MAALLCVASAASVPHASICARSVLVFTVLYPGDIPPSHRASIIGLVGSEAPPQPSTGRMIGMKRRITSEPVDADAGLVEALRRDDAGAAGQLVERYGDCVYRLALRITGGREDAEDVTEDALGTVARTIGAFTRESEFGSWIERITATAAYRKLSSRPLAMSEIALDDVLPPLGSDGHFEPIDDWTTRFEPWATPGRLREPLTQAIDALPADYRMALILRDSAGWSSSDIAETLGLDPSAIMSRVHRARLFVRKRLAEYLTSAR